MDKRIKIISVSDEVGIDWRERGESFAIDEHLVAHVHKVISGSARDGPVGAQRLLGLKYFFCKDPGLRSTSSQPLEILLRVAQTVGMVDAHSIKIAVFEPLQDANMGCIKD